MTTTIPQIEADVLDGTLLLTREEVAAQLRCSTSYVDELRRADKLPAKKLGNRPRFKWEDVVAYADTLPDYE